MANKTKLLSIDIAIAQNGYIVSVEYDTDEPTKDPRHRRVTEKHIARGLYCLWDETIEKVLRDHEQR
jgi:hypothetical protein